MMKEVVGGSGPPLSTIERPDAKILLEFGGNVTGALVAKRSSREYRRRLKAFLSRFEHDYAGKISGWDGKDVFAGASAIVEEAFTPTVKVTTYPTILGIEDLLVDKRIGGVTISVTGKTGSGKSTFCLRYAASLLKRGHPVIIVDGSMPPNDIRKELGTNGIDVVKLEEQGLLILYDGYSEISGIESREKYKLGSPGELNTINLSLSRNLTKLKNATVFLDSLTAMIEYSDLELAVDFIRTLKVKLQQGDHTAFFILDSNAHDVSTLNYINHVMDGEIETVARRTKKGEPERLVSFKRLNGFQIKTGYHQMR
jgi:KaiC/GvpD/RAD55 family RecA-like ATPase